MAAGIQAVAAIRGDKKERRELTQRPYRELSKKMQLGRTYTTNEMQQAGPPQLCYRIRKNACCCRSIRKLQLHKVEHKTDCTETRPSMSPLQSHGSAEMPSKHPHAKNTHTRTPIPHQQRWDRNQGNWLPHWTTRGFTPQHTRRPDMQMGSIPKNEGALENM